MDSGIRPCTVAHVTDGQGNSHYPQIAVRSVGRVQLIDVGELSWVSSAGNYVELHIDRRSVLHRQTLTSLVEQLDPDQFMRVHRSAAVNRHHSKL